MPVRSKMLWIEFGVECPFCSTSSFGFGGQNTTLFAGQV